MPPQLETTDKQDEKDAQNSDTEEQRDSDEDQQEDGTNPYKAEIDAKARVVQLRDKALGFWHKDQWESIMNMYTNESFFDPLLCWIRPTRDFLSFVHAELRRLHVTKIVSVGCGCGFLEWLIKRACSGIEVIGYEVDRSWWQGHYGVKPFIEHIYIDEVQTRHVPAGSVLMTCYFHSWECWNQYLAEFRGDIIIVIGPHTNDHLTFPEPRHLLTDPRFVLESQREIAGGDKIVIVRRNAERWPVPPPPPEPAADAPPLPSVKPPEDKLEHTKRYNEMRRSLVIARIGSAKENPAPPPPVDPKVRQGPALRSTYTTRKPSLAFSLGGSSVASRLKNLGGAAPAGMKRSASCSAHLESLGSSADSRPAPRRKTTAPGRAGSSRASGTVTPDGWGTQRLGVAAPFAGRPLRESRSVPSLATLQERAERDDAQLGDGEQQQQQQQQHDGPTASSRRRRPAADSTGHQQPADGEQQPDRQTESTRRRRPTDQQPAENGAPTDGQSQQNRADGHRRRTTAQEERRQRTRPTEQQPNHCEQKLNGWGAAQDDGTPGGHEEPSVRQSARGETAAPSPPLVTVTDLSSERRQSLRRPSWSLFSGSSPSR